MTKQNKKIFLIFHGRFPSEKAAALFAAKSAESFGEFLDTTLLVPRRFGRSNLSCFDYYNVKHNFKVVFLPTLDFFNIRFLNKIAFHISHICFSISCLIYLFLKSSKCDIIYSNENLSLYVASFLRRNSFYEMHDFPGEGAYKFYKKLFSKVKGAIIHNAWKVNRAESILGVSKKKIFCEMNAVEVQKFNTDLSKEDARNMLGIPQNQRIVVYTGHLYDWKGTDTLALCGQFIPHIHIYFVGGTQDDVLDYKTKFKDSNNLIFVGHRQHEQIPIWQKAADVLVIPNTAKKDISKYYTSPMKLFEYMASGRVIVASRIPSICEIVSEYEVLFFEPDNTSDLAHVIEKAFNEDVSKLPKSALQKSKEHTWQKRAQRILTFIGSKVNDILAK